MQITMKTTIPGSRDGLRVESFRQGETYDLTGSAGERDLAAVFVREGWASEAGEEKAAPPAAAAPEATEQPAKPARTRKA